MTREVVNESSVMTVRARFFSANNVAQTPSTARYRIRDLTNDRVVKDWTTVTAAHQVDIIVSATDNAIYQDQFSPYKRFEERVLTVQADYDTSNQYSDEVRYLIKNLRGFDS